MPDRKKELPGREAVAVVRFAPDGKVLSADSRACELFGYPAEEIAVLSLSDIDPRSTEEERKGFFGRLSAGGAARSVRELRRKDGSLFPATVIIHRAGPPGDGPVVAFICDVSTDLWTEAALRESEERLRLALKAANQGV